MPRSRHERLAIACVALVMASLVVFALRVMLLRDVDRMAMLPDDAFYYLTLARNYAADGVWSFDGGVSLTTGFHPLLGYLLVPLAGLDARGFIDVASVFVFVVALATLGAAAVRARDWNVRLALAIVGGSAMVMLLTTIVIEWALAVAFMALFWAELARGDGLLGDPRVRLRAGLWLGLAVLARSDAVLLVGTCGAVELIHAVRTRAVRWRALVPVVAGVIAYAAVAWHSAAIAGSLSQGSAATKLDWALSVGVSPGPILTLVVQLFAPFELRFDLGLSGAVRVLLLLGLVGLVVAAAWLLRRLRRPVVTALPGPLVAAAAFTVIGYLGAYSFNSAAIDTWYTAAFIAPLVVLVAWGLGHVARLVPLPALAVVVVGYLVAHGVVAHRLADHRSAQRAVHALALETKAHVQSHRTAAFNAGLFGFLQDGKVINIDGLVNADIGAYRRADRLACYLVDHDIGFIEDVDLMRADAAFWRRHGDSRGIIRAALRPYVTRVVAGHEVALYVVDRLALAAHCP